MTLYEFKVNDICNKHTHRELAKIVLGYQETNAMMREDNENLRKENETLRTLIAKYSIQIEETKNGTNADKIRSMSDEALAEFFIHTKTNCELCNCLTNECLMDCSNGILDWLKSEAE